MASTIPAQKRAPIIIWNYGAGLTFWEGLASDPTSVAAFSHAGMHIEPAYFEQVLPLATEWLEGRDVSQHITHTITYFPGDHIELKPVNRGE